MFLKRKYIITLLFIFNTNTSLASDMNYDHAISVFNKIKYERNFESFDYVNPNAPKKELLNLQKEGLLIHLINSFLKGFLQLV